MLKIGVGPSSSHTLGPWKAAIKWIDELKKENIFNDVKFVTVDLYGSLSLTGKGHATDIACVLGLSGADPETFDTKNIHSSIEEVKKSKSLNFNLEKKIDFDFKKSIVFHKTSLPFHPNALTFTAIFKDKTSKASTFYSIGGGFIVKENYKENEIEKTKKLPFPINSSEDLLKHCKNENLNISEIVTKNEHKWLTDKEINIKLNLIWDTMYECMFKGAQTCGVLPGGLNVKRRAFDLHESLIDTKKCTLDNWISRIRSQKIKFNTIFKWVSCFALSVNEVNASLGRVVTAPTNGSAGVIPAVIMYYLCFLNKKAGEKKIQQFLKVAGEIGCIFKKKATISAALGGCQAEIGVSSAMAAAGLTEILGGTPKQVTVAAEIAMEHHLGLTCDPVKGLVQIPCIERNSMGAIKAIHSAELALEGDGSHAKVSLDQVIETMWETAKTMHSSFKETSTGGLAITVNNVNC